MNKQVLLREATRADLPLIMAWRSQPSVFFGFYQQEAPLLWDEHSEWWDGRNKDWRCFIIVLNEGCTLRDIGVVNIGQLDHWSPEVGYFIGEVSLWGNGYGTEAVKLAMEWLKERGYKHTHTTVLESNKRSLRLLKSLGFEILGKARKGEVWLTKSLPSS